MDGFGKQGEWKKLEGTCLEKDMGEYVAIFFFFVVVTVLINYMTDILMKYVSSTRRDRSLTKGERLTVLGTSAPHIPDPHLENLIHSIKVNSHHGITNPPTSNLVTRSTIQYNITNMVRDAGTGPSGALL